MELTPELLLEAKFSSARRGYDMAEVDDFLERCAEGLDVLLVRLRAEFDRAEQAEAELASVRSGNGAASGAPGFAPSVDVPSGDVVYEEPIDEDEHPDTATEPAADADVADVAVGEPMRILIHAERTAEAAIAEASAEAERIRTDAETVATAQRSEAETLVERARAEAEAEARRAGDEARRAIQGEVVTLRRDRDSIAEDVALLRRWLDDQRGRLRSTARDLHRLAEDPSALGDVGLPEQGEERAADGGRVEADTTVDDAPAPDPEPVDEASDGEPTQAIPAFHPVEDNNHFGHPNN